MATITYTVSTRLVGDPTAATGLTLSFLTFKDAEAVSALSDPTFTELENGFYSFPVAWDDAAYDGIDHIIFVIDCGATIGDASERYITGRIGRYDVELGTVSATLSDVQAATMGKWEVVTDQLVMYEMDGVTVLRTFNLFDALGVATSEYPAKREPV